VSAPTLVVQTPAKLNWVLEVLGKRPDGFHELALVFQTLDLWDELAFYKKEGGLELEVLESPEPLAADDSNLILRAARLFFEAVELPAGLKVRLKKKIPMAAGLGGGSSDAAATLWALNRIYEADLPLARLRDLAAQLGSDVPFFLTGGAALGSGRGEKIEPWEGAAPFWVVLAKPEEGLSTPKVYQSGRAAFSDGAKAKALKAVLQQGNPADLAGRLFNGLEPAAFYLLPRVQALKNSLLDAGALGALVSGSGPTVFALARDEEGARALADKVKTPGVQVFTARTVPGGPRILP